MKLQAAPGDGSGGRPATHRRRTLGSECPFGRSTTARCHAAICSRAVASRHERHFRCQAKAAARRATDGRRPAVESHGKQQREAPRPAGRSTCTRRCIAEIAIAVCIGSADRWTANVGSPRSAPSRARDLADKMPVQQRRRVCAGRRESGPSVAPQRLQLQRGRRGTTLLLLHGCSSPPTGRRAFPGSSSGLSALARRQLALAPASAE